MSAIVQALLGVRDALLGKEPAVFHIQELMQLYASTVAAHAQLLCYMHCVIRNVQNNAMSLPGPVEE